jgi:very-short-patch-repair endonuclease
MGEVFPQVAIGALLEVRSDVPHYRRRDIRNRFPQKIVDLVLVDGTTQPRLLIEVDDRTHNKDRDQKRDRIPKAAGIKAIGFRNVHNLSDAEIARQLSGFS